MTKPKLTPTGSDASTPTGELTSLRGDEARGIDEARELIKPVEEADEAALDELLLRRVDEATS